MTLLLYCLFFSFLFAVNTFWRFCFRWLGAKGLNTLTSKHALCPLCQNPLALTSRRASSPVLLDLGRFSPVTGVKCGSIATSLQTSDRRFPTTSLMQVSIWPVTIPPGHPGAFAPKCVPSPGAFAQQKMPGGRANKGWCPWGRAFVPTGFQTWKLLTQLPGLKN